MTYTDNFQENLSNDRPSCKRFVGHRVRELLLVSKHLFTTARPRVMAFSCDSWNASSGLLWGSALYEMRALGWDVVLVPGQLELSQRQRLCSFLKPDAILFLKARTWKNHPRHFLQYPSIFLIDDADFLDINEHDHVMECVQSASLVIAGNEYISTWCKKHNSNVEKIWVPHPLREDTPKVPNRQRPNIIIWAPGNPVGYGVESSFIIEVIRTLQSVRSDFEFWMTGCQNKEWASVFAQPLLESGVHLKQYGYFKAYKEYSNTIAMTPIGLHPVRLESEFSNGKSFGKILSYIVSSTTVVTDPVPDHNDFITHQSNGMLAATVDDYVKSISYLLDNPQKRDAMAQQAYTDFENKLATPVAAQKLDIAFRRTFDFHADS